MSIRQKVSLNNKNVVRKEFSQECNLAMSLECEKIRLTFENRKPIESPKLNYLKVFKIQGKEKTYTQFLGWLLSPDCKHNLGIEPLSLFLKKMVNSNFKFNFEKVKVETEKAGEKGVPDLKIEGKNFICYVEIKIAAKEGENQTKTYYKEGKKEARKVNKKPFFVYLRLRGKEDAKSKYFTNIEWGNVIESVLGPCYVRAKESVKEILQMIIYNLQINENKDLVKFFENEGTYKENMVQYYNILKLLQYQI